MNSLGLWIFVGLLFGAVHGFSIKFIEHEIPKSLMEELSS